MTDESRQVDLIIQTKLQGGRDLKAINDSIEQLQRSIERQIEAAKRGEGSFNDLKASVAALAAVQNELSSRSRLIESFERANQKIAEQGARVDELRKKLAELEATQASGKATERQIAQIDRLTTQISRAQDRYTEFVDRNRDLGEALRQSGVNTSSLGSELQRIQALTLEGARATNTAVQAQANFNDTLAAGRAARKAAAEEEKRAAAEATRIAQERETAARRAEQAEADRLAIVQRLGQAEQQARGRTQAQSELAAVRESVAFQERQAALQKKAADEAAAAARRAEQAEADRLAIIESAGRRELQLRGQLQAQSEQANVRDSLAFQKRVQDETKARDELNKALAKNADEADQAARKFTGLARVAADITPRTKSLASALQEITNPAAVSRQSISGLTTEIGQLADAVAASEGRVDDYRGTIAQLAAAQRAAGQQAGLIDSFNQQIIKLRQAREAFVQARTEVAQYAAQVRQGGESGQQFVRSLNEAQARLRASAAAVAEQTRAARESRQALRDAGIATNDLAGAQDRLVASARRAAEALKRVEDAQRQSATAPTAGGRSSAFALFNDEGRTTLSLMQRIRGEILAVTAGFVGLYGVIDLARTSLQAYNQQQNLANTLGFAFGNNTELVGQQMTYLRQQTERLGISYDAASRNFARFSAAAVKSGASIQETNFIFESFSEVARVIGLTPDELNGIFNAIGQSFSKGKIQAEELRQQIGERLPGAFAFAQEALRKQFPDLNKALEQGQVGAENLVLIAESVRKAASTSLPAAIRSLDAEQQRFNNSVLFFKKEIADSGFADAYIALLKELRDFFRSEDGKAFAQGIGQVFAFLVDTVRQLVVFVREFAGELKALAILVALVAGNSALGAIVRSLAAVKAAMAAATIATAGLSAMLATLNVAALGFVLGTYLREQFESVELASINLVINLQKAFTRIEFAARELWENFPQLARAALGAVLNNLTRWVRASLGLFRSFAEAVGFDSLVKGLTTAIDRLTFDTEVTLTARTSALRQQREEELARIEQIGQDMMVDAIRRRQTSQATADPTAIAPTGFPGARESSLKNEDKDAEKAAKRRESEIEALTKQLDALDARLDRAQGDNLARQLEAIDTQYRALAKRIAEIGGKEAVDLGARWGTLYSEARNAAIEKFNEQRLKAEESLQSKVEQVEAAAGRKQREDLGRRIKAISDAQQALVRDLEAERDVLLANGRDTGAIDELIRRAEAAKQNLVIAEAEKFNKEDIAAREKEINDLLTVRKERIDQIRQAEGAGEITDVEAIDRIRAVIAETQPRIDEVALSARTFAENLRGAVDDSTLDAFIAKIEAARNSGARLNNELVNTGKVIREGLFKALDVGIDAALQGFEDLITGTKSWGEAFKNVGRSILAIIADVIRQLIAAAIRTAILRAISGGSPGGGANGFASTVGMTVHSGGVIGTSPIRRRAVDATWFANAPRYHSGGIVGLRPDEYPAILQRNEEVLSKSDPRNVMNGGGRTAPASDGGSVRVVLVDDPKRAAEQLAGSDGERVVLQHIRSNLPTLRTMLK